MTGIGIGIGTGRLACGGSGSGRDSQCFSCSLDALAADGDGLVVEAPGDRRQRFRATVRVADAAQVAARRFFMVKTGRVEQLSHGQHHDEGV